MAWVSASFNRLEIGLFWLDVYPWTLNILACTNFHVHWLDKYASGFISSIV